MTSVKIGYNHPLCKMLQARGYSVRLSQDIVRCVFDTLKEKLLDHQEIELPFGRLWVSAETRRKQRRIGLNGMPEWVYKREYVLKFKEIVNVSK